VNLHGSFDARLENLDKAFGNVDDVVLPCPIPEDIEHDHSRPSAAGSDLENVDETLAGKVSLDQHPIVVAKGSLCTPLIPGVLNGVGGLVPLDTLCAAPHFEGIVLPTPVLGVCVEIASNVLGALHADKLVIGLRPDPRGG
jgi:hypothetical protein